MRIATVTALHNEADLLPSLLGHYSPLVDDMWLLDNETDDGSMAVAAGFPNVHVRPFSSGGRYIHRLTHAAIVSAIRSLAATHDYVLAVDPDEIVVPRRGGGLREALSALPRSDYFWTEGFEMVGMPWDAPFDPARPISGQRTHGVFNYWYCKPAVVRPGSDATPWWGFHWMAGRERPAPEEMSDAPFLMLHYRLVDEEVYVRRAMDKTRRMSPENLADGMSTDYHARTEASYREEYRAAAAQARPVALPPATSAGPTG